MYACMIIIGNIDPSSVASPPSLSLRSPHRGSTYRRSSSRSKSSKSKSSRSYSRSSSRSRSRSRSLSRSRYFLFCFFLFFSIYINILHLLFSYLKVLTCSAYVEANHFLMTIGQYFLFLFLFFSFP